MAGLTFTVYVGCFTSPGIDTRYEDPNEKRKQSGETQVSKQC